MESSRQDGQDGDLEWIGFDPAESGRSHHAHAGYRSVPGSETREALVAQTGRS
jgi:hypothetical protein